VPIAYALILPMVLVAVTVGPTFLGYWIGPDFAARARLPMILLVAGMGALVLGTLDGTFLEGVGKPQIRTGIYAALAAMSLPLCYFWTRRYGINGAAAMVCLAFALGAAAEVVAHQALVARDWWYVRRILPRAAAVTAFGLAVGWGAERLTSGLWSTIGVGVLAYLSLALVALRVFHTNKQFKALSARIAGGVWGVIAKTRLPSFASTGRQTGH